MKVQTAEQAALSLGESSLDSFVQRLSRQLPIVGATYSAPSDSGPKTALSRLFAYLLLRGGSTYIYISSWGIWGAYEHLDLFYGYRRSHKENRPLIEAPVHVFVPTEQDAFVSILSMALYFMWDAWVFGSDGTAILKVSHDGWFELRATDDGASTRDFASELGRFRLEPLSEVSKT